MAGTGKLVRQLLREESESRFGSRCGNRKTGSLFAAGTGKQVHYLPREEPEKQVISRCGKKMVRK